MPSLSAKYIVFYHLHFVPGPMSVHVDVGIEMK